MEPWEQEELARLPEWAHGRDARNNGDLICPSHIKDFKRKRAWWKGWTERHREIIAPPPQEPSP